MEWVSMAEQLHPSLTSPSAMQSCTLEQWRRVLWSDESLFSVWQSGHVWVWRLPGERYLPDCIVPSVRFCGGGLWCGVVFHGLGLAP
ncbi:unnamed protein product [Staurois parvus]|uniref:Uncharacterized protein n=1 Tax=Staurois parvus TaxID=386267 RepID=A0ABN9FCI3_9NEOB|nr:unnamed protein product [Staurois parvus]